MITERITPKSWLWRPRTTPIKIAFIHATRGGAATQALEYTGTKNWFQSDNNRYVSAFGEVSGGCASSIIGPNGEQCIVLDDDKYPAYSGCYGSIGPPQEYCLDQYAKSYELAQQNATIPFTEAQYERLAIEVANDCKKHGIAPVFFDCRAGQFFPVPSGITRHDRSANGSKLGKSDPGPQFNETKFLEKLSSKMEDIDMPDVIFRAEDGRMGQMGVAGLHHHGDIAVINALKEGGAKIVPVTNDLYNKLTGAYHANVREVTGGYVTKEKYDALVAHLNSISQRLTNLEQQGIQVDIPALVKAVNDDAAERMKQ